MITVVSDTLVMVRGEFSMEDPWAIPDSCDPVRLRHATDGSAPRLATTVSAYYDDQFVTIVFSAADDHIVATHFDHDAPLYEEDVVEVFVAPHDAVHYFEVEVNPIGTTFDARIESPRVTRFSMHADIDWDCPGLVAAVRRTFERRNLMTVDTVMRIPFESLDSPAPRNGDVWRGNFFRIDRHPTEGDEFSAWRPTMRNPADFHVVACFGRLLFRE